MLMIEGNSVTYERQMKALKKLEKGRYITIHKYFYKLNLFI